MAKFPKATLKQKTALMQLEAIRKGRCLGYFRAATAELSSCPERDLLLMLSKAQVKKFLDAVDVLNDLDTVAHDNVFASLDRVINPGLPRGQYRGSQR